MSSLHEDQPSAERPPPALITLLKQETSDFPTYLARHGIALMLLGKPPIPGDFSCPEEAEDLRETFFETHTAILEAVHCSLDLLEDADATLEDTLRVRHSSFTELLEELISAADLPVTLAELVRQNAAGHSIL